MTDAKQLIPRTASLEDIKVEIRNTYSNPNIGKTHQVVLKEGPRAYRIATVFEILDSSTGDVHHHALRIDAYKLTRAGWLTQEDKSQWITSEPDELKKLVAFIRSVIERQFPSDGTYHIVDETTYQSLEELIHLVQQADPSDKLRLLQTILTDISRTPIVPRELAEAFSVGNGEFLNNVAAAARMVNYRRIYDELTELVCNSTASESAIQNLLSTNPWLFGSEYSELVERRTWTRDDRLDFMLRRTIDDYLEIIEIKTPFAEPLMRYDDSHDSYFPSAKLSAVLGQVVRYIEEVERQRDAIIAKDGYDTLKIRARVIIGRDGNQEHQKALHNFNAHLHRVEIITFDQLLRTGNRVLDLFQEAISEPELPEATLNAYENISFEEMVTEPKPEEDPFQGYEDIPF